MSRLFEQLDHQITPLGDISLRRRLEPTLQVDIWEVKLGDEFLMSSLFTAGERAVADLGLAATHGDDLRIVVGGLGLGYTARQALTDDRVASVHVIDTLAPVIGWHERGLVPIGSELADDPRCTLVHGDFFAMVEAGLDGRVPGAPYDAILLDIDHTPSHLLHAAHAGFYRPDGLRRLADQLVPGGVFSLWSDEFSPNEDFVEVLRAVFDTVDAHVVAFPNHYTGGESTSTIYVSSTAA
ncbi:MAG: spermidine synthase [Ilumatobacteraceae bacterium]|nr:spermidine synthase [Ilumatobacteraceae bacterium]